MAKMNHHYQKLSPHYLFPEVERRVAAFKKKHPDAPLVHLGIADVTEPIPSAAVAALVSAAKEMGTRSGIHGYGPSQGYLFLREAIAREDYKGLSISEEEIFISDGAKCDLANLQEIFDIDNKVALPDPTYPVYLDTTVMAGRTRLPLKSGDHGGLIYLPCSEENGFQPRPPFSHVDLIYLCSPNNPTGIGLERSVLEEWVEYAKAHRAVILFDGSYEAYVQSEQVPRSIYEIPGAKEVAIEVRSFSKSAGFTGLRCSYTVVPEALRISDAGTTHSLHAFWKRRTDTKFNGVSYPIQRAAEAIYTPRGQKEVQALISTYRDRAQFLLDGMREMGWTVYGGIDAPYLWWKVPDEFLSWSFFDLLLEKAHLVTTPGRGFGRLGEGFIRLTTFQDQPILQEALSRLSLLDVSSKAIS